MRKTFISCSILLMFVTTAGQLKSQEPIAQERKEHFVPLWLKDAVFYQIFPERFANGDTSNDPPGTEPWGGQPTSKNFFGGDLKGIIDHLDYVSSLGVNALYLNPIFQSGSNHKYTTDDYLRIDPAFGDEATFKKLVDECHSRGIRVILDGVFNHTGTGFFAFKDLKENGARSRYAGWYNVYSYPVGPPNKPNYEAWWGYGDLPKLMTNNPEVRNYLFRVTEHWMNLGIDGWRLDVPNEIPHPFWIEWRKLVKSINPDAYIVGEIWDDARPWLQGDQFDGVMNYRFRAACLDFFATGKTNAVQFGRALAELQAMYPGEASGGMQNLLGSHDTERLLTLCRGDKETMKLAWLFQMTYTGAPMVYYGDEIGMMGGKDPGCRGTMIWDKDKQDDSLLGYMESVIRMRREELTLRQGSFEILTADATSNVVSFARKAGNRSCLVILNNSSRQQPVRVPLGDQEGVRRWSQLWPQRMDGAVVHDSVLQTTVPAKSGLVFTGGKE